MYYCRCWCCGWDCWRWRRYLCVSLQVWQRNILLVYLAAKSLILVSNMFVFFQIWNPWKGPGFLLTKYIIIVNNSKSTSATRASHCFTTVIILNTIGSSPSGRALSAIMVSTSLASYTWSWWWWLLFVFQVCNDRWFRFWWEMGILHKCHMYVEICVGSEFYNEGELRGQPGHF